MFGSGEARRGTSLGLLEMWLGHVITWSNDAFFSTMSQMTDRGYAAVVVDC